jgi:AraC-like DNA-binding protein
VTQQEEVLFQDEDLTVLDVRCSCRRHAVDEEETTAFEVVLPTSGAFERRTGDGEVFVDAANGYVAKPGGEHRIRHLSHGDRCLALVLSPRAADEVRLDARSTEPVRAATGAVASAVAVEPSDALAAGEAWLRVLTTALDSQSPRRAKPSRGAASASRRQAVAAVREAIVNDPSSRWTMRRAGALAGYAPHHLGRVFAAHTNLSVSEYRDRVRLSLALDLVRDGVPLADVAATCGFCDHSHLTRRAKALFGTVPSRLRVR